MGCLYPQMRQPIAFPIAVPRRCLHLPIAIAITRGVRCAFAVVTTLVSCQWSMPEGRRFAKRLSVNPSVH